MTIRHSARYLGYAIITLFVLSTITPAWSHEGGEGTAPIASAEKEVVKVTERGFEPSTIKLHKDDSTIFFVNMTREALLSFEVDFGAHRAHCASGNMKFSDGVMRSIQPVGPRDFGIMCFPEKGSYKVTARGVLPSGAPLVGNVIVE